LQKREKELDHLIITDSLKESVAKKNKKLEELINLFLKKHKEFYEKQNKTCLTCGLSELDLENGDRYTRMVSCLKLRRCFIVQLLAEMQIQNMKKHVVKSKKNSK
jgi:hypothetical protein